MCALCGGGGRYSDFYLLHRLTLFFWGQNFGFLYFWGFGIIPTIFLGYVNLFWQVFLGGQFSNIVFCKVFCDVFMNKM